MPVGRRPPQGRHPVNKTRRRKARRRRWMRRNGIGPGTWLRHFETWQAERHERWADHYEAWVAKLAAQIVGEEGGR